MSLCFSKFNVEYENIRFNEFYTSKFLRSVLVPPPEPIVQHVNRAHSMAHAMRIPLPVAKMVGANESRNKNRESRYLLKSLKNISTRVYNTETLGLTVFLLVGRARAQLYHPDKLCHAPRAFQRLSTAQSTGLGVQPQTNQHRGTISSFQPGELASSPSFFNPSFASFPRLRFPTPIFVSRIDTFGNHGNPWCTSFLHGARPCRRLPPYGRLLLPPKSPVLIR